MTHLRPSPRLRVLAAIDAHWRQHRRAPLHKELVAALGHASHGPLVRQLSALRDDGLVTRTGVALTVDGEVALLQQRRARPNA